MRVWTPLTTSSSPQIQDGLLRAETMLRIVCLESEELHLISNGAETSHHVAIYSTLMSKKRLTSSQPVDIESFRMKYATFLNVWRMLCLRTPGRPALQGVTGALGKAKTVILDCDVSFREQR